MKMPTLVRTQNGMNVDDFIRMNADPIWLHQNEMWEYIDIESDDVTDRDESYDN